MSEADQTLRFYATPGVMTDLRGIEGSSDWPAEPREIAAMVQGLLIHPFWATAYDVEVPDERQPELQVRSAAGILAGARGRADAPLTAHRAPHDRFLGNCRDFSTTTVALLRHAGTPARARCGFAGYFEKDKWVDHWVVEHWDGTRWVMLDPQIDELQREVTGLAADPADLPLGFFLPAGDAWMSCRRGEEDPDRFGILDMWGAWFIAGNVGRDLASLNKIEMLPWDDWGALARADGHDDTVVDEIAALLASGDTDAIRARYDAEPDLQVTSTVMSLGPGGDWVEQVVAELA